MPLMKFTRVITSLGTVRPINTGVIEKLFTMDLAYLQDMYERINSMDMPSYKGICPHCGKEIDIPINFMEAET